MDIVLDKVISHVFCSFKRSCPPRETKLPEWNLSLVLRKLTHPPYEPLKLSVDKHLTCKNLFLLLFTSGKQVNELHGLPDRVRHLKGWRSCTFSFLPDFMTKSQNPSAYDPHFEEFTVPSLADFADEDRDKIFLCPIRIIKRTEQFKPKCSSFFVSMIRRKKWASKIPFYFGLDCDFPRLSVNH